MNNLPSSPIQPGTKIIVRQRANGDTEYICRPDEHTMLSFGDSNGASGWIIILVMLALVWRISAQQPSGEIQQQNNVPSPVEAIDP